MSVGQDDDRRSWTVMQAALVLILCRDELRLPSKLRRRMLRWMQRSPEHLIHLFEIARVDQELDRLKLLNRSTELSAVKPRTRRIPLLPRRAVLLGGAATAAICLGIAIPTIRDSGPPIRHQTLDDGSIAHVLRGADIDVDLRDDVRVITVSHGEAIFEVAKAADRPFIVRTPWSDSIAVGTRFGVVTDAGGTTTTVSEGEVRVVVPAGGDQTSGTLVRAGEELRVAAGSSRPQPPVTVDAERKMSWAAGWLQFRGEPVGTAVETFNRFSDVRIEITQPELAAERMLLYRFEIENAEAFAIAIGAWLEVPVSRDTKRNVIYIGNRPGARR